MRNRLLLALATILVAAALSPAASATNDPPPEAVCYTQVPEAIYSRPTVVVEHQLSKHTRTREETVVDGWQRYSFTGYWLSDTIPPPGPAVWPWAWQANTASDPHGVGVEGAYYQSSGNSGNGDWFWLEATETPGGWGPWSDPAPWGNGLVDEQWVVVIPEPVWTPHGSGPGWERQRAALPTGETREVPGEPEVTGWLSTPPEGDGWTVIDERLAKGGPFPCPTASATPGTCDAPGVVTYDPAVEGRYSVSVTGDDSATSVVYTAEGDTVLAEPTSFGPFDLTQPSAFDCADVPEPTTRFLDVETVDCDSDSVVVTRTSFETPPVWDAKTETYVPGVEVVTGTEVIEEREADDEECPPEVTTTTTAPPTTATTEPPAQASSTSVERLPDTGSNTSTNLWIGGALLAAGLALAAAPTVIRRRA